MIWFCLHNDWATAKINTDYVVGTLSKSIQNQNGTIFSSNITIIIFKHLSLHTRIVLGMINSRNLSITDFDTKSLNRSEARQRSAL